jgi:hypothetical protein
MGMSIETKNRRFAKLSRREKRVAVAKDVLKQLDAGSLKASKGVYLALGRRGNVPLPQTAKELQAHLLRRPCEACAIGAAFASTVRLGNHLTAGAHFPDKDDLDNAGVFTNRQLDAMEMAYEQTTALSGNWMRADSDRIAALYPRSMPRKARLRAIFQNIVRNNGEFRP